MKGFSGKARVYEIGKKGKSGIFRGRASQMKRVETQRA